MAFTSSNPVTVGNATKKTDFDAVFDNTTWLLANLVPAGALVPYAGSSAPAGSTWLLADGSVVSQTTYAALFAVCGTTYNTGGEGAGNFRLPDLRGRAPIGAGTGTGLSARTLGQTVGAETHQLTIGEMPAHSHTQRIKGSGGAETDVQRATDRTGAESNGTSTTASQGGGGSHNNMQPSLVLNYLIRTGL